MINTFVGAGIFGLPSTVFELTGAWSIAAFVGCGALVALIVACFAEVASRFRETGGAYLYAHAAFGPALGFQVGWLMWITRLTAFATIANLMVVYLSWFVPGAASEPVRGLVLTAIVAAVATISWLGIRQTAVVSNLFTAGKLIPLIVLVTVGLTAADVGSVAPAHSPTPDSGAFALAIVVLVFAFSGFEVTTISAGEARNPSRDYPFALFASLGFVVVLYVLIQIVCMATVAQLGASERPLVDAGVALLGEAGGTLIGVGALVSMAGTLNAIFLGTSRLPYALAENAQIPAAFARLHPRHRTPTVAIVASALLIWVASLAFSFLSALTISSITKLMTYVIVCAALYKLRRVSKAPFHLPAGTVIVAAAIALCLWLLTASRPVELLQIGAAIAVGTTVYFAARRQSAHGAQPG